MNELFSLFPGSPFPAYAEIKKGLSCSVDSVLRNLSQQIEFFLKSVDLLLVYVSLRVFHPLHIFHYQR